MADIYVEKNIVIDETDIVVKGIEIQSGKQVRDLAAAVRFMNNEKFTAFYIDRTLSSYTKPENSCLYVWLDTGYVNRKGEAIFVSLLKEENGYRGHYVGTIRSLADMVINHLHLNRKKVQGRITQLCSKYADKAAQREHAHMEKPDRYLLDAVNDTEEVSEMASKLMALNISFPEAEEVIEAAEETAEEIAEEKKYEFTLEEEQITIDILLKQMERMQFTIDELYSRIESMSDHTAAQNEEMDKMATQIAEYRSALVRVRSFMTAEEADREGAKTAESGTGHSLLGSHGQILVVGGDTLGVQVMQGIAKDYGFEKADFDFISYDKAKSNLDRIRRDGRYKAIIFGACPHKTAASGVYNSALDKFLSTEGMPYTVDARCKRGTLKVTKQSFREALEAICGMLRGPEAA